MTEFLVRRFVKDHQNMEDASTRTRYGLMASIVGICCNLMLFAVKLVVGILINSISVMADAFNNLSDAAASIVGFVGVKMAEKPADADHPFGHGRIEYIAAFIVAFLVIQVGFSLFKTSFGKISRPEELTFHAASVVLLIGSVCVKLWMAVFNRTLGNRIQSTVLLATSADSLGDVAATTATILSVVVFGIWQINLDGIVGLVVSVLVMIAGINIAKDTLAPLIGEAIDPKIYRKITEFVESYDGVIGSHDLIVHNYGPSRSMASIHAEVPSDVDIQISHEIVDRIEHDAYRTLGIFLVIHMDPVEQLNERIAAFRNMTEMVLKGLDPRLSYHDFRVVDGTKRVNLLFDLVVPRDYTTHMQDALKQEVCQKIIKQDSRCHCIITVESTYCVET